MILVDWKIGSRSTKCSATEKEFQEGDFFYTVLEQDKQGNFLRRDLCEEAWRERNDNIKPLCFWKTKYKPAPPAPAEPVEREAAESELRRLLENPEPGKEKLCYLLSLMLERKRIIRARERTEVDGKRLVAYEHTDTQETFLVEEVDFSLSEIEQLQKEIGSASQIFGESESPQEVISVATVNPEEPSQPSQHYSPQ